ncbi:MAG TPA: type II toxin-antitoxin system prevent-host-death family antitoxin [Candidatus Eremiobacteraceae bacterium]|jgi:prevent-host-death family protein|nr:type II toxin-antitoxin system prevent-host-death family antitoxin [Candidatus Eremiobacteraceae bacterium]
MKLMAASTFKAKCLSLIRQVGATGESVTVTRRGKPIAKLVPAEPENDDVFGFMQRKGMRIIGDITAPIPVEWKVMKTAKKKK